MANAQYKKEQSLNNQNQYLATQGRPKSLKDSFDKTNLDLENPNPLGGPNRTNSSQIPSGIYSISIAGNSPWQAPSPGGVLKDIDGNIVKFQLQRWTKDNKYLDSFDGEGNQNS